jgi:ABC-type branched-subunit amino acid transport system ATPase component
MVEKRLLDIRNLDSWYWPIQILHGVNMHLNEGEIVSIIGPNGAGKSTVLKNIFGLISKRKGHIFYKGKNIIKDKASDIVKKGITFVPQGRSVFPSMTVRENLELGAYIKKGDIEAEMKEIFRKFPRLKERQSQKAGLLSGGEQQMVAIGRALMLRPKLMLLDEPSLGLSPQIKKMIFEKVVDINKNEGISFMIVEQNAKISLSLSDRAYVLELGRNKLDGPGKQLLKDPKIQSIYLGGGV